MTFTANSATRGGAVYVHATFARLDHCLFRRNNASEVGGVAYAAGDVTTTDGRTAYDHDHIVNTTSTETTLYHTSTGSHAPRAAGAKLKVTHGTLSENRARAGAAFAAFYAHLEIKHTRAFFEPTWDFPFGDQEIHLLENGTGYGCHNEPHFNKTGNKKGWERCWDSSDEASMLLYQLAILCMVIIAGVANRWRAVSAWNLRYFAAVAGSTVVNTRYDALGDHMRYFKPGPRPDHEMPFADYLAGLGSRFGGADAAAPRRPRLEAAWRPVAAHENELKVRFLEGAGSVPGLQVLGVTDTSRPDARTPTFAVAKAGLSSWALAEALCEQGVWCTAGNHYAGFWHAQAVGLADNDNGMARVGLLHYNTVDEVDRVLRALDAA